jgi:hypothetical protein
MTITFGVEEGQAATWASATPPCRGCCEDSSATRQSSDICLSTCIRLLSRHVHYGDDGYILVTCSGNDHDFSDSTEIHVVGLG